MVMAIIQIEDSNKKKILSNYITSILSEKKGKAFSHKDKFTGEFHEGLTESQWKNKILNKIREDFFLSNDSIDLLHECLQEFVENGLLVVREKETHIKVYG